MKPYKTRGQTHYYKCATCGKDVKIAEERVNESFIYVNDKYYHLGCLKEKNESR